MDRIDCLLERYEELHDKENHDFEWIKKIYKRDFTYIYIVFI